MQKRTILIVITIVLVLVVVAAAGAFYFLRSKEENAPTPPASLNQQFNDLPQPGEPIPQEYFPDQSAPPESSQ